MSTSGMCCPQIVTDVIDRINRTPHKFFTLQELADSVYVCPKTLSSQFKSSTGMTIHKYQTDLKMKMANSLLNSDPTITLREVAKQFGYYDEFHFSPGFSSSTSAARPKQKGIDTNFSIYGIRQRTPVSAKLVLYSLSADGRSRRIGAFSFGAFV